MKKQTDKWIKYAEDDLGISRNLFENTIFYNGCIYHCQQCMEKILKALLIELNIKIVKSHNLDIIFDKLPEKIKNEINISNEELQAFNEIYISSKYPVDIGQLPFGNPQKSDAEYFMKITEKTFREVMLEIKKSLHCREN